MKRFHVHVNVTDLPASLRFYTSLFGREPSVEKPDYAKWMLDDPRLNFAISNTGREAGVDHLGLQADSAEELAEIGARLDAAQATTHVENATTCCYAQSDKVWTADPQQLRWESFFTFGEATTYSGRATSSEPAEKKSACCSPAAACC